MNSDTSKRVVFSEQVTLIEYEIPKENHSDDPLRDWMRQEPRHISPLHSMTSVQNLLEDTCRRRPVTVVYGNLGRYPKLVQYYLDVVYSEKEAIAIRVGTHRVDDPIDEDAIAAYRSAIEHYADDERSTCDVLFWIEPRWGATVERPRRARRLIVLTSHLRLNLLNVEETQVVAHHVGDASDVQMNVKIPPLKQYVRTLNEMGDCDYSFVPDIFLDKHVEILGGWGWTYCGGTKKKKPVFWDPHETVCADLTHCKSLWEAYLRLLTARDIIRYSSSTLKNWSVAIDERLKEVLLEKLTDMKNKISTKYAKMACNVNGVNVMVEQYIDPFLINR